MSPLRLVETLGKFFLFRIQSHSSCLSNRHKFFVKKNTQRTFRKIWFRDGSKTADICESQFPCCICVFFLCCLLTNPNPNLKPNPNPIQIKIKIKMRIQIQTQTSAQTRIHDISFFAPLKQMQIVKCKLSNAFYLKET